MLVHCPAMVQMSTVNISTLSAIMHSKLTHMQAYCWLHEP